MPPTLRELAAKKVEEKIEDILKRLTPAAASRLPHQLWQDLLRMAVRRGRTRDTDLLPLLGHISSVPAVDLSGCADISDAFLRQVATAAPAATALRIDMCRRIGEEGIRAVCASMTKLEYLSIRFSPISERALLALAAAQPALPLKSLLLSGTAAATEAVLNKIFAKYPTLEHLDISHCRTVTASVIKRIGHDLPALVSLDASWASDYGDCATKLTKRGQKLVHLGVADSKTSDSSLAKLLSACPTLVSLDVSNCPAIFASIDKVAKQLAQVVRLNVGGPTVTDSLLLRLAQSCPLLEDIDVGGCHKITPEGLRAAVDAAKQLKVLTIGVCKLIPEKSAVSLKEAFPALRIFHVRVGN